MSRLLDYLPQFDVFDAAPAAPQPAPEGAFGEYAEMELAAALLDVGNEAKLDQYLRALLRRAGPLGARVLRSPMGPQVMGQLKHGARVILAGLPGSGGPVRHNQAARLFGLELEGLSPEDREFALARQFVRFAGSAALLAGRAPAHAGAVRAGLKLAARRLAPGLLPRIEALPRARGNWRSRRTGVPSGA